MSGTITHSWNGTILTVTSDSGTSSADLKGDIGVRGPQGAAGVIDTSYVYTKGAPPTAAEVGAVPEERKVNNHSLANDITLAAADIRAVPEDRKVNNHSLIEDITLTAADVGAVPTERTINSKPLTSNIKLTASDVGATLEGFGVGETVGRYCADCYAVKEGGLYYVNTNTLNVPNNITGSLLVQPITATNGTDIYLTLKNGANVLQCYYSSYAKAWQPWEWVNPPMEIGTEYRTTERYNGSPVYQQVVSFGNFPNVAIKNYNHGILNVATVIYWSAISSSTGTNVTSSQQVDWIRVTRTTIDVKTSADATGTNARFILKYTKTTN